MFELLGRAVVVMVPAVAVFYIVTVLGLFGRGGLERVPGAIARGLAAAALWVVVALALVGCASAPVPPEVRARGEAMLLEMRAADPCGRVCCEGE